MFAIHNPETQETNQVTFEEISIAVKRSTTSKCPRSLLIKLPLSSTKLRGVKVNKNRQEVLQLLENKDVESLYKLIGLQATKV